MPSSRGRWLAGALTAGVLASRFAPSAALIDAATGEPFQGRLAFPFLNILFTPFCSVADLLTCNGARQDIAFAMMALIGFALFRYLYLGHGAREWHDAAHALKSFALYGALLAGFMAWAFLWPHRPARLVLDDPDLIAVDFHSHSGSSAGGRRSFTAARSAAWHEEAGYGAGFLTDLDTTEGRAQAQDDDRRRWSAGERTYASLAGEEASLHHASVVVLGNAASLPLSKYSDDDSGLKTFLSDVERSAGTAAVFTLPDYWRYDWATSLERFSGLRTAGLEIWASSPVGMEFPEARRREAVELCRKKNLFMAGGTDERGYGSCACIWNVIRLPGWRNLDAAKRQEAILAALRKGFAAVQVVARPHVDPAPGDAVMLDGPRALWLMARAWNPWQCLSAVVWLWLAAWLLAPVESRLKW